MNQTTWIIGGGALLVFAAVGLFFATEQKEGGAVSSKAGTQAAAATEALPEVAGASAYTRAIIHTSEGDITLQLYGADAPKTVENFAKLAKDGFYNGTKFHRVIKGFMIQGGDPNSKNDLAKEMWGMGGPGYEFEDEINEHKLVRGSLAMANSGPGTNGSQFFIVTAPQTTWLDGKHTNFGEVVSGYDVVAAIEGVATGANDRPIEPIVVTGVTVE